MHTRTQGKWILVGSCDLHVVRVFDIIVRSIHYVFAIPWLMACYQFYILLYMY